MTQTAFIEKSLEKYRLIDAKPTNTPASSSVILRKVQEEEVLQTKTEYQQMIGSLI